MNLPTFNKEKLFVVLSFVGVLGFYLWQPIQDIFITHNFDEAMNLVLESETHDIDKNRKLLVLHIKPLNRGNVAIHIKDNGHKDSFILELKKIDIPNASEWLETDQMKLINKVDLLRHYQDGYVIESNTFYDEVESIPLEKGFYLAKVTLTYENGDVIDQSLVVNLNDEVQK